MRRILLAPSWWARHLALVAFLLAFALLGRWQWDVSRSPDGTLQNTIYAFQWWVFGLTAVYCWWWLVRHELRGGQPPPPVDAEPPATFADEDWVDATLRRHRLLPPPADATADEVRAFRAYLAELNAADHATR